MLLLELVDVLLHWMLQFTLCWSLCMRVVGSRNWHHFCLDAVIELAHNELHCEWSHIVDDSSPDIMLSAQLLACFSSPK